MMAAIGAPILVSRVQNAAGVGRMRGRRVETVINQRILLPRSVPLGDSEGKFLKVGMKLVGKWGL